jgi:deoxyadenosine/deoxycytidine kinase
MTYIEGTIGAGKSTFLKMLQEALGDKIHCIQEPVQKWVDVGILQAFYENPQANAYKFQTYTFLTRWQALREADKLNLGPGVRRIVERSIYSDRYVFAEGLHESGMISDMEWTMYCEWWGSLQQLEQEVVREVFSTSRTEAAPSDRFIYLRANPERAFERMQKRNRDGESDVSFEYIRENVARHDRWLLSATTNQRVLVIDVDDDFESNPDVFQQHLQRVCAFLEI